MIKEFSCKHSFGDACDNKPIGLIVYVVPNVIYPIVDLACNGFLEKYYRGGEIFLFMAFPLKATTHTELADEMIASRAEFLNLFEKTFDKSAKGNQIQYKEKFIEKIMNKYDMLTSLAARDSIITDITKKADEIAKTVVKPTLSGEQANDIVIEIIHLIEARVLLKHRLGKLCSVARKAITKAKGCLNEAFDNVSIDDVDLMEKLHYLLLVFDHLECDFEDEKTAQEIRSEKLATIKLLEEIGYHNRPATLLVFPERSLTLVKK